jgi:hypothetical protein
MSTPTEFFRWFITDERTGKRRRATYRMSRKEAHERFGNDGERYPQSRELRNLPAPDGLRGSTTPPRA